MVPDLSSHIDRTRLAGLIAAEVDTACVAKFSEPPRTHLGASIIGHPCAAYCWFVFRWVRLEQHSGQMYRLFNRGHKEEARFVDWLEAIGFEVRELDPETKKQYRVSGYKGHFGGSLDGLVLAPERYQLSERVMLTEFKTHGENSFTKLAGKSARWGAPRVGGDGVIRSKPQHFRQMSTYGRAYNIRFGLYCAVNKNTDELYYEVVEHDFLLADDLVRKSEQIIDARVRPQRIANTPTYSDCRICDFAGVCHKGEAPAVNCRSCTRSVAVENGEWFCEGHGKIIPPEVIATGCPGYTRIV